MASESEFNSMHDSIAAHKRNAACGDPAISRRHFLGVAGSAAGGLLLSNSLLAATAPRELPYPMIADSVRDFSNEQGYDSWYYGYTLGQYSGDAFLLMPLVLDKGGGNYNWLVDPTTYLTRLSAEGGYPNGVDVVPGRSQEVHRPVRRWVSTVDEKVEITGILALLQPDDSLDGLTGSVYADGRLVWTQALDKGMPSSSFDIELRVSKGMRIDFVVAPGATSTGDAFLFTAQIAQGGCNNCCHADPPARYLQGQLPWGPLLYDHKLLGDTDNTIKDVGCALTCLSMALVYSGVPNTPGSLNTFMVNANCYERESHWVRFQDTVREIRRVFGKTVQWRDLRTNDTAAFKAVLCAGQDPTRGVFQIGHPIIVAVRRVPPLPGVAWKPQHFVLLTGLGIDQLGGEHFQIFDPARGFRDLGEFNSFEGRGYVVDPPDPLSGLNMDVADASLVVTDSAGRRTGFDAGAGPINQIPGSVAYGDSLDGDVSGIPAESFCSSVNILQPSDAGYNISITGVIGGVHELSIRGYSDDGSAQQEVIVSINVPAGETMSLDLEYSPTPGSVPQLTKTVAIAVKRGSINLNSKGVIPVAILSTPTFDATEIDPLSVRFGPGSASEAHGRGHIEDTNGDGRADLVLHFAVQESGITADLTEVCLTGRTRSGTPIRGCAPI